MHLSAEDQAEGRAERAAHAHPFLPAIGEASRSADFAEVAPHPERSGHHSAPAATPGGTHGQRPAQGQATPTQPHPTDQTSHTGPHRRPPRAAFLWRDSRRPACSQVAPKLPKSVPRHVVKQIEHRAFKEDLDWQVATTSRDLAPPRSTSPDLAPPRVPSHDLP
jgi:hypothetical protein